MELPATFAINAWTGEEAPESAPLAQTLKWGLNRHASGASAKEKTLAPPPPADLRDWRHANVGWGLVLPENEALSEAERATAADAPEPIQNLVADRKPAPVLRYRADLTDGFLRRYYPDRKLQDLSVAGSTPGVGPGCLPRYLLLLGGPDVIPWRFQYSLNMSCFTGRLSLTGEALERYVQALMTDWKGAACDPRAPLVWAVNHGASDITALMEAAIARRLCTAYDTDPQNDLSNRKAIFGAAATVAGFVDAVSTSVPALIVTTSHGMTGPLNNPTQLVSQLGFLVDVQRALLAPSALLNAWQPQGAIWYAHACCSAGSDAPSTFVGLLAESSSVATVLKKVAESSGARVASLPEALLGAERPLRAFVGHVEPTFDWTLRNPETGQPLVHALNYALYNSLYQQDRRTPIAFALARLYAEAGEFLAQWLAALDAVNANQPKARERALYRQLVAMDRQHAVILGDPTVSLPLFAEVN